MTILGNAVEGMAGGFRTLLLYLHALWLSQSVTSQVCLTIASSSATQHLSGCFFFLKTSFGKTDVTECWNQLLSCGTPFKCSPLSPLGRLEIQMIYLSIICYRGCVLQPKPGTMNFGRGFIYNNLTHTSTPLAHTGDAVKGWCSVLVGFAWVSLICMEVGHLEEAQEFTCTLEARSSF